MQLNSPAVCRCGTRYIRTLLDSDSIASKPAAGWWPGIYVPLIIRPKSLPGLAQLVCRAIEFKGRHAGYGIDMDGAETAGYVISYDLLLIAGDLNRSTRAEGAAVNWVPRRGIGGEKNGCRAYPIHHRQDAIGNRAHGGGFGTEGEQGSVFVLGGAAENRT